MPAGLAHMRARRASLQSGLWLQVFEHASLNSSTMVSPASPAGRHVMDTQNRRRFLATLSAAGGAGLIGASRSFGQEPPPETTTVRLGKINGTCIAPQYVAEEL